MSPLSQSGLARVYDYILWYSKTLNKLKFRPIFQEQNIEDEPEYIFYDLGNGEYKRLTPNEIASLTKTEYTKIFKRSVLTSSGYTPSCTYEFEFKDKVFKPMSGKSWHTHPEGMQRLIKKNRIMIMGNNAYFRQYYMDFPLIQLDNSWTDTAAGFSEPKRYIVQTATKIIQRCMLMTTDPGDLVLDPTCGSGTTAFVAEQWGRRWITIDTSRIAIHIAKTRIMTAVFPYYHLVSDVHVERIEKDSKIIKKISEKKEEEKERDVRLGFVYEEVPHITLKSLANDEPPETETLYDKPYEDKKKMRVSGPFTVETLQSYEPVYPDEFEALSSNVKEKEDFEQTIKEHLLTAGIKNGRKAEQVVFKRIDFLQNPYLHAEGFYDNGVGEKKAYIHIGPKFSVVSKQEVNEAIKECRLRGDAQWLLILGFSFESDIENTTQTFSFGKFEVTKVRIHDDLLQEGLKKKPSKTAASFVTIGEPDIEIHKNGNIAIVEVKGMDIYNPVLGEVIARETADIHYWMVDDNYDGSNFIVRQVFFCGGERYEFDRWKRGLTNYAESTIRENTQKTLRIEINEEAFKRLYGYKSHPIPFQSGQKVAVQIITHMGEEMTKVFML